MIKRFGKNSERLLAITYFRKNFFHRRLTSSKYAFAFVRSKLVKIQSTILS